MVVEFNRAVMPVSRSLFSKEKDLPLSKSEDQNSLNPSIIQKSGVSCKPDNTCKCPCIPWSTSLCMSMRTPPGPMIAEVTKPVMTANKFNAKYWSCLLDQNFCSTSRSVIMSLYMRHTGSRIPKKIRLHFWKLRETASCHEHRLCFGARIPRKSSPAIAARPPHAIGQSCIASGTTCNNAPGTYAKSRQAPEYSCFSSFARALATFWAASGQARLAMSGAMPSRSMPMKTVNETPRMVRKNNTPQRWVNSTCKVCTAASANNVSILWKWDHQFKATRCFYAVFTVFWYSSRKIHMNPWFLHVSKTKTLTNGHGNATSATTGRGPHTIQAICAVFDILKIRSACRCGFCDETYYT